MTKKKVKNIMVTALLYLLLIFIAFVCAGPFIWLVFSSFKGAEDIYTLSLFPKQFSIGNYQEVFSLLNIGQMLWNSVIITVGGIVIDVVFSSLCAYPLAKIDFYGKKVVATALVATMIIPAAAGLVVNYLTITNLNLMNNFLGVILPNSVAVFSIILLRQSYMAIPKEIIEASRIDGASELKIWRVIMIPQILPSIATIVIMDFIGKWNTFLWPLIILDVDKYPVATGLKYLSGQFNYKFGNVAAGTVFAVVPIIIVFISLQKYYINTMAGAVKG